MPSMQLPKGGVKYEQLKLKPCQYPGCEEWYMGTGTSKYCTEHRKRKYRKEIDKIQNALRKNVASPNRTYKHCFKSSTTETYNCECCGTPFELTIYPNIYVYPKYCPEHRNEFKRKLFDRVNGRDDAEDKQQELLTDVVNFGSMEEIVMEPVISFEN